MHSEMLRKICSRKQLFDKKNENVAYKTRKMKMQYTKLYIYINYVLLYKYYINMK